MEWEWLILWNQFNSYVSGLQWLGNHKWIAITEWIEWCFSTDSDPCIRIWSHFNWITQ